MIKKNKKFTIAIDGSSASGKTTGSKIISKELKFKLLSSGKLYRYLAFQILKNKKKYNQKYIRIQSKKITFQKLKNKKLDNPEITKLASTIAKKNI